MPVAMAGVIEIDEETGPAFALHGQGFSYAFAITPEGLAKHLYIGPSVCDAATLRGLHRRTSRENTAWHEEATHSSLNDLPQEYPVAGASDYRHSCLAGSDAKGRPVGTLIYRGYSVADGAPDLGGLPSGRGEGAQTLTVTMEDPATGLVADLHYTVWSEYGVLARSVQLRNEGSLTVTLSRALSACLALPPGPYEALHLHGRWAHEFQLERIQLPTAQLVIESTRGTSSAAHHPFLALAGPGTTEEAGTVAAMTMVYSGDHRHTAERGEFGEVRLSAGIGPSGFSWRLEPGEAFTTPQALIVHTEGGLGGMSRVWHKFVRDRISPARWRGVRRPSYLNTWEAAYFAVSEDKVLQLADRAARLGLDMLVLDDGWFEGRTHAATSLGVWRADAERFPSGIANLAKRITDKALKFGLWVEPEMVSPDSSLLAHHPDWILRVPGRTPSFGRSQYTLDLTNPAVADYIYQQVAALLSCGNISYIKWDMNRPMTDRYSPFLSPDRQGEVAHRYTLALYALLDRLTTDFPDVLIETCASGGNRFDLGMLSFCPQGWLSDMVDPVGRAAIVSGASLIYPTDVMAAYVGPSPNHQTGRITSLQTRMTMGAMLASQGISLGEADLQRDENALRLFAESVRNRACGRLNARFDRLLTTPNETIWQQTTADGAFVTVIDLHVLAQPGQPYRRACLRGLAPNARYRQIGDDAVMSGAALMGAGLRLPHVTMMMDGEGPYMPPGDFASVQIELERL